LSGTNNAQQRHVAQLFARPRRPRTPPQAELTKPIAKLMAGDRVWAWNERLGAWCQRSVVRCFRGAHAAVWQVELVAGGRREHVRGTAKHPFWVCDRGWVGLRDMRIGERVRTRDGAAWHVGAIHGVGVAPVYNIEVEGLHNYAVGQAGVLVHNASLLPDEAPPPTIKGLLPPARTISAPGGSVPDLRASFVVRTPDGHPLRREIQFGNVDELETVTHFVQRSMGERRPAGVPDHPPVSGPYALSPPDRIDHVGPDPLPHLVHATLDISSVATRPSLVTDLGVIAVDPRRRTALGETGRALVLNLLQVVEAHLPRQSPVLLEVDFPARLDGPVFRLRGSNHEAYERLRKWGWSPLRSAERTPTGAAFVEAGYAATTVTAESARGVNGVLFRKTARPQSPERWPNQLPRSGAEQAPHVVPSGIESSTRGGWADGIESDLESISFFDSSTSLLQRALHWLRGGTDR
jgi:hypothetical protein